MSNIDKQALRDIAEKAISEEGVTWWSERQLSHEDGLALHDTDAKFIAAASPATMLALLDDLEAAEKRNAELVHNHRVHAARLIDERGQLKQRIAELEARTVKLPYLPDDCDRTEAHFKYQEAIREAGIEIAAGIGEGE